MLNLKRKKKRKAGRKLNRIADSTNPVISLINAAIDQTPGRSLQEVASAIGYSYRNLWCAYRGYRKMPILALRALCRQVGGTDTDALELFERQPTPIPFVAKNKKESDTATASPTIAANNPQKNNRPPQKTQ